MALNAGPASTASACHRSAMGVEGAPPSLEFGNSNRAPFRRKPIASNRAGRCVASASAQPRQSVIRRCGQRCSIPRAPLAGATRRSAGLPPAPPDHVASRVPRQVAPRRCRMEVESRPPPRAARASQSAVRRRQYRPGGRLCHPGAPDGQAGRRRRSRCAQRPDAAVDDSQRRTRARPRGRRCRDGRDRRRARKTPKSVAAPLTAAPGEACPKNRRSGPHVRRKHRCSPRSAAQSPRRRSS
eukprot:scaffold22390_cov28-Tisochrysis_lutea.AAC.5